MGIQGMVGKRVSVGHDFVKWFLVDVDAELLEIAIATLTFDPNEIIELSSKTFQKNSDASFRGDA